MNYQNWCICNWSICINDWSTNQSDIWANQCILWIYDNRFEIISVFYYLKVNFFKSYENKEKYSNFYWLQNSVNST